MRDVWHAGETSDAWCQCINEFVVTHARSRHWSVSQSTTCMLMVNYIAMSLSAVRTTELTMHTDYGGLHRCRLPIYAF